MTFSPTQREELRKLAERFSIVSEYGITLVTDQAHRLSADLSSLLDALDAAEVVEAIKDGALRSVAEWSARALAAEARAEDAEQALGERRNAYKTDELIGQLVIMRARIARLDPCGSELIADAETRILTAEARAQAAEGALLSVSRDHAQTTCSALEWRPIETAPRDGTLIDLWVVSTEHDREWRQPDASWNVEHGDWQLGQYRAGQFIHKPRLTHWKPSPAPPGSASTGVAAQVVGDKSREKLESRLTTLEEALRPFAKQADDYEPEQTDDQQDWPTFTIGDFRRARSALAGEPG